MAPKPASTRVPPTRTDMRVEIRPVKARPVVSRGVGDSPRRLSRRYRLAVWVNGRIFGWATSQRDAARLTRIWRVQP